jgi:alpha-D-ribose 1-methylphosphonate 5-phosphate C-P lyase
VLFIAIQSYAAIAQQFCNDSTTVAQHLRNFCAMICGMITTQLRFRKGSAIVQRLQLIAKQLRIDFAAISQRLYSDFATIAQRWHSFCAMITVQRSYRDLVAAFGTD